MIKLAVIGAGPAGVSAALYAHSRGLDVKVFEQDRIGGLLGKVSKVSHFASAVEGENGPHFAARLEEQLKAAGIEVVFTKVEKLERTGKHYLLKTAKGDYEAEGVILASGSTPKDLPIALPEDAEVRHFALGSEDEVKDKVVVMNGGSDGAVKEALYLARFAREVHIVQDQPKLMCIAEFRAAIEAQDNVRVHTGSTVQKVTTDGHGKILSVELKGAEKSEIAAEDGIRLFVLIGQSGNAGLLGDAYTIEGGYLKQDTLASPLEDNLWAAGDVLVKAVRQAATAVNDGCLAGIAAAKKLQ